MPYNFQTKETFEPCDYVGSCLKGYSLTFDGLSCQREAIADVIKLKKTVEVDCPLIPDCSWLKVDLKHTHTQLSRWDPDKGACLEYLYPIQSNHHGNIKGSNKRNSLNNYDEDVYSAFECPDSAVPFNSVISEHWDPSDGIGLPIHKTEVIVKECLRVFDVHWMCPDGCQSNSNSSKKKKDRQMDNASRCYRFERDFDRVCPSGFVLSGDMLFCQALEELPAAMECPAECVLSPTNAEKVLEILLTSYGGKGPKGVLPSDEIRSIGHARWRDTIREEDYLEILNNGDEDVSNYDLYKHTKGLFKGSHQKEGEIPGQYEDLHPYYIQMQVEKNDYLRKVIKSYGLEAAHELYLYGEEPGGIEYPDPFISKTQVLTTAMDAKGGLKRNAPNIFLSVGSDTKKDLSPPIASGGKGKEDDHLCGKIKIETVKNCPTGYADSGRDCVILTRKAKSLRCPLSFDRIVGTDGRTEVCRRISPKGKSICPPGTEMVLLQPMDNYSTAQLNNSNQTTSLYAPRGTAHHIGIHIDTGTQIATPNYLLANVGFPTANATMAAQLASRTGQVVIPSPLPELVQTSTGLRANAIQISNGTSSVSSTSDGQRLTASTTDGMGCRLKEFVEKQVFCPKDCEEVQISSVELEFDDKKTVGSRKDGKSGLKRAKKRGFNPFLSDFYQERQKGSRIGFSSYYNDFTFHGENGRNLVSKKGVIPEGHHGKGFHGYGVDYIEDEFYEWFECWKHISDVKQLCPNGSDDGGDGSCYFHSVVEPTRVCPKNSQREINGFCIEREGTDTALSCDDMFDMELVLDPLTNQWLCERWEEIELGLPPDILCDQGWIFDPRDQLCHEDIKV